MKVATAGSSAATGASCGSKTFTEDEMALIARAQARGEDVQLDAELKDWKP